MLQRRPVHGACHHSTSNKCAPPGEYPGEPEWTAFEALLVEYPARVLFWEGPPIAQTVARLETLGVQSSVYNPCANVPAEGDFLSVAQANAQALEDAAALLARVLSPPRDG